MTATTQTDPLLPRFVPALCCECGAVRQAGFRNASTGPERPLKCSACGRQTTHAMIAPEGWDYREKSNRETKLNLSMDDQLDLLRSLGARIYEVTERPSLIAGVSQYLDDDTFHVDVNPAADPAQLTCHLAEIVDWVGMPSDKRWFVSKDEDGVVYANVEWCS